MVKAPRFSVEGLRAGGWLWIGAGAAVGLAAWFGLAVIGLLLRPAASSAGEPTPILTILPGPSPTPTVTATPIEAVQTPTATVPAGTGEGLRIGELVEVFGTSGDGLRLRSDPELQARVLALGVDSEVFQIEDGPVEADGFQWWYLVNPYDTSRQGWAVSTYLRLLGTG
jgi:hypothetical protein